LISLVLAGLAAGTDWWAVRSAKPKIEGVAKPLVMVGLIWWVAVSDANDTTRAWVGLALVLGLLGDLFLLPAVDKFELGLGSFLLGHLAYIGAALGSGHNNTSLLVAGSVGAPVAGLLIGWPLWKALEKSRLRWPVMAYTAVTTALMMAVARTGLFFALTGAVTFAASDTLLGQTRFLRPRDDLRWIVHCLYHVGQALLVIGLLNAV
jgi:alkenylglycerophosphocholine/alkenylglycerophosphoethanolamine hydrolase